MISETKDGLDDWLNFIESQHPEDIELGLDRIFRVTENFNATFIEQIKKPKPKVITVAGSNGKGTTVALLEAIAIKNDYHVLSFTSPHLISFNERIRYNGIPVKDELLIESFEAVENARQNIPLTFFEFTTLAALYLAFEQSTDVLLLVVGLGGRLDAVNILESDIAVITSLSIDHVNWLGSDLLAIAKEKIAIARTDKPLVLGDEFSHEIQVLAEKTGALIYAFGHSFQLEFTQNHYVFHYQQENHEEISISFPKSSSVHPKNICAALMCAFLCGWDVKNIKWNLLFEAIFLPGRYEIISEKPKIILDVSHNVEAIKNLATKLSHEKSPIILICGMLKDKQIKEALQQLCGHQYQWYLIDLETTRGAKANDIKSMLPTSETIKTFTRCELAMNYALEPDTSCGTIIVFGSFLTVEASKKFLTHKSHLISNGLGD